MNQKVHYFLLSSFLLFCRTISALATTQHHNNNKSRHHTSAFSFFHRSSTRSRRPIFVPGELRTTRQQIISYRRRSRTLLDMCQLLGINSSAPADLVLAYAFFSPFAKRGGETDVHSHGWGLCTYDHICKRGGPNAKMSQQNSQDQEKDQESIPHGPTHGLRSFRDSQPAAQSMMLTEEFFLNHIPENGHNRHELRDRPSSMKKSTSTSNVVAHIRYATRGEVKMENVHPFVRKIWGREFCFAHNGDVSCFDPSVFNHLQSEGKDGDCRPNLPWIGNSLGVKETKGNRHFFPIGDTDSEAIFCAILNALLAKFDDMPDLDVLHAAIALLCEEIIALDAAMSAKIGAMTNTGNGNHGNSSAKTTSNVTILNFLMGCGSHAQFAYSWPGKREGSTVWNGLHYSLVKQGSNGGERQTSCHEINRSEDGIAVIATAPLASENEFDENNDWVEIQRGQLILFEDGRPRYSSTSLNIDCNYSELEEKENDGPSLDMFDANSTKKRQQKQYKVVSAHRRKYNQRDDPESSFFRPLGSVDIAAT
ncbi:hypothetical protein ACHAXS_006052 [Conticribra weissflogii]